MVTLALALVERLSMRMLSDEDAAMIRAHMQSLGATRWLWGAGILFDLPTLMVVWPDASWAIVLGARLLGAPLQPLLMHAARKTRVRSRTVGALSIAAVMLFVFMMALQASELGGLESPYLIGLTLFISAAELFTMIRVRLVIALVSVGALIWTGVLIVAGIFDPRIAAQWSSLRSLMLYVGMWGFIAVFAAVGVRASQQLAGLRQELAAARRLAAYRLEARLGVGGMNEVWLARHERNGRAVALKILKRMPSEVLRQRFEREGATLRALRSPHTVRVLDVGSSDDGVMFIVMEAIEGVDLECLVRQQGPLSLSRALRLARHVCASLSEAHAAGIVHRDIKPSNLMVSRHDGRDHLCVIDFGIAHVDNPDETLLTNARSVIGTPQYMAPEAFDHAPATAALDIYGLGATISFMVTGYRPFEGLMGAELVHAVRNEAPDVALLAQRSPALCDLVLRCLAKDPTQRPHSIAELDTALAALETADRTTLDDSFEHCATMREVTRAPLRDTPLATTT